MKHTLETLLPLLDTPEGLEKLRILTAEADGWRFKDVEVLLGDIADTPIWETGWISDHEGYVGNGNGLPNYTTSLDAIFAAEERLGLPGDDSIRHIWQDYTEDMLRTITGMYASHQLAFLTAAQRCILFILTAQAVRPS